MIIDKKVRKKYFNILHYYFEEAIMSAAKHALRPNHHVRHPDYNLLLNPQAEIDAMTAEQSFLKKFSKEFENYKKHCFEHYLKHAIMNKEHKKEEEKQLKQFNEEIFSTIPKVIQAVINNTKKYNMRNPHIPRAITPASIKAPVLEKINQLENETEEQVNEMIEHMQRQWLNQIMKEQPELLKKQPKLNKDPWAPFRSR